MPSVVSEKNEEDESIAKEKKNMLERLGRGRGCRGDFETRASALNPPMIFFIALLLFPRIRRYIIMAHQQRRIPRISFATLRYEGYFSS